MLKMEIIQVLSTTAPAPVCHFRRDFFVAPELHMLLTNTVAPGIAARITRADLSAGRILTDCHVVARE
jgi:hypothetical protein